MDAENRLKHRLWETMDGLNRGATDQLNKFSTKNDPNFLGFLITRVQQVSRSDGKPWPNVS